MRRTQGKPPTGKTNKSFKVCCELLKEKYISFVPGSRISEALVLSVLENIKINMVFVELEEHMTEQAVLDNHVFLLIKAVARNYIKIRMHHFAKEYNDGLIKHDRVRKKLSKVVLFKHQ